MRIKSIGAQRAKRRVRGYTFGEILIVAGVIIALAITALVVYNQLGRSSEMNQVASQIGQRISTYRTMREGGTRPSPITMGEFSGALGSLVSGHPFMTGVAPGTASPWVGTNAATTMVQIATTCGAANQGFTMKAASGGAAGLESVAEAQELHGLIVGAMLTATNGIAAAPDVFLAGVDNANITAALSGTATTVAPVTTGTAHYLMTFCFD